MKKGICPKCNGKNIYTSRGKTSYYGDRTNIQVSVFNALRTTIYVCTDCGFFEEYINSSESFDTLKSKWVKV